MKAIEILEAISTKIKEGEYVGNIGIIVQIKDDEMLEEGKKAKSILEAFAERVELKVVKLVNINYRNFQTTTIQFSINCWTVWKKSGKITSLTLLL